MAISTSLLPFTQISFNPTFRVAFLPLFSVSVLSVKYPSLTISKVTVLLTPIPKPCVCSVGFDTFRIFIRISPNLSNSGLLELPFNFVTKHLFIIYNIYMVIINCFLYSYILYPCWLYSVQSISVLYKCCHSV